MSEWKGKVEVGGVLKDGGHFDVVKYLISCGSNPGSYSYGGHEGYSLLLHQKHLIGMGEKSKITEYYGE